MEAKIAKIGLVILIATVAFRFMLTEKLEVELYSIFKSVDRNMGDFDFDKVNFDTQANQANVDFSNDYSKITTKVEAERSQELFLAQLDEVEDQVPSDYVATNDFENVLLFE